MPSNLSSNGQRSRVEDGQSQGRIGAQTAIGGVGKWCTEDLNCIRCCTVAQQTPLSCLSHLLLHLLLRLHLHHLPSVTLAFLSQNGDTEKELSPRLAVLS